MRSARLTTGSRARAALCSSVVDTSFHWIALTRTRGSLVCAAIVSAVRSIALRHSGTGPAPPTAALPPNR